MVMARLRTQTYEGAVKLLGDSHERVTIGNNTTIESDWMPVEGEEPGVNEQFVTVRLHGHAIVRLYEHGVAVRDCGYVTATTYERINAFLPPGWTAHRKDGRGYVARRLGSEVESVEGDAWLYVAQP